jgi:hypothetical protein
MEVAYFKKSFYNIAGRELATAITIYLFEI